MAKWDVEHNHVTIGGLIFPNMDQMDFTGPFEVLSLLPGSRFHVLWKELTPVRDARGLVLAPDTTLRDAPALDVLLVPGHGQEPLMDDTELLDFLRVQAGNARFVFPVCTGALLCGAAGLLRGVRSTTHWNSFHPPPYFGAIPVGERVVVDGRHVSAAGLSSGIDGALRLVERLRGARMAQAIQLHFAVRAGAAVRRGNTGHVSARHCGKCQSRRKSFSRSAAGHGEKNRGKDGDHGCRSVARESIFTTAT